MARLEVALLGEPAAAVDGTPVDLGPRRNGLILATLALARGATVVGARLADVAWDGAPPAKWDASLHSRISRLRSNLGAAADRLVTRPGGYAVVLDPDALDIDQFEREAREGRNLLLAGAADAAVALLERGLGRFPGTDTEVLGGATELAAERAALSQQRATAFETLVDARLACGHHEELVSLLDLHVREFPFRERAWAQLATALARGGRQAEALRRLEEVRVLLRDELGIIPGPELRALERAILDQDPQVSGGPFRSVPGPERSSGAYGVRPGWLEEPDDVFVARGSECETIIRGLTRARTTGRTVVTLVRGEPGIGKTRTVIHAIAELDGTPAVLAGRCDEDPLLAFQPFAEMLAPVLAAPEPLRVLGDAIAPLALIAPGLPARCEWITAPDVTDSDTALSAAVVALERLRKHSFGTEAIIVVIDDVHWIPDPALRLLRHVVRTGALGAALIVLTARPHETTVELGDALLGWAREHVLETIEVQPLDDDASAALAAARGASSQRAASACARAGGNPFYVEELVRHLDEANTVDAGPLPATVVATVARRLERLPDASRPILELAAVAGSRFQPALLARATAQPAAAVLAALAPAARAGFVIEPEGSEGWYGFSHAIVRDVLQTLLGPRRPLVHGAIAAALADATTPAGLAEHAFHAGEAAIDRNSAHLALTSAMRAAAAAMNAGAGDDAERVLAYALGRVSSLLDPGDETLLEIRLEHSHLIGQIGAADRALELLIAVADDALAAHADRLAGRALLHAGLWTSVANLEIESRWRVVKERIADEDDETRLLAEMSISRADASIESSIEGACNVLARIDRRPRSAELAVAIELRALGELEGLADPAVYLDRLRHIAADKQATQSPTFRIALLVSIRMMLLAAGEVEEAAAMGREAEALAQRLRVPRYLAGVEQRHAMFAILEGRFADADAHARAAVEIQPTPEMMDGFAVQLFATRKEQGRLVEIADLVREYVERDPTPAWQAGYAMVLASIGDHAAASALLDEVLAGARALHARGMWPWPEWLGRTALTLCADTASLLDATAAAAELLVDLERLTSRLAFLTSAVSCLGAFDHYRARLHLVGGDHDAARVAFEGSLALHERLGARPFVARDRLGLARTLEHLGAEPERAQELRRTARAIVRELGLRDPLVVSWDGTGGVRA